MNSVFDDPWPPRPEPFRPQHPETPVEKRQREDDARAYASMWVTIYSESFSDSNRNSANPNPPAQSFGEVYDRAEQASIEFCRRNREEHLKLILQYHPELSMEELQRKTPQEIAPLLCPILDLPEEVALRQLRRDATGRRPDLKEEIERMSAEELWKLVHAKLDEEDFEYLVGAGLEIMQKSGREFALWAAAMYREFDNAAEFLKPHLYKIYQIVREILACEAIAK